MNYDKLRFSAPSSWQGLSSIQQILCFESDELYDSFYEKYNKLISNSNIKFASDSGIGALYKLRGVAIDVDNHGNPLKWVGVVRCGETGKFIWESTKIVNTSNEALLFCLDYLKNQVQN